MSDETKIQLTPADYMGMAQRGCAEVYAHLTGTDPSSLRADACIGRLEEVIGRLNVLVQWQNSARAAAQNGTQEQRAN